jgi:hypothetical protein
MTFAGTPRPKRRWHHAATELEDFAIVTYRVCAQRLKEHLPEGFAPREFAFDDGATGALVSAVVFRDRDFHFRLCRAAAISCGQINYRAYVTAHGQPGVWFFGTALDHGLVGVPRLLWGMPWRRSRIGITAEWDASPARWRMTATGPEGTSLCDAVEDSSAERMDGFTEHLAWLELLTHPTTGWYPRRGGRVGTYSIWHPPMRPRRFTARSARFTVFEELGLTTADSVPHSILAQPTLHFDIHTPPGRYAPPGIRSRAPSGGAPVPDRAVG